MKLHYPHGTTGGFYLYLLFIYYSCDMKDKLLPWFLLFCALGLSGTAAYYSVVGLSVVFVGVALPVIVKWLFSSERRILKPERFK